MLTSEVTTVSGLLITDPQFLYLYLVASWPFDHYDLPHVSEPQPGGSTSAPDTLTMVLWLPMLPHTLAQQNNSFPSLVGDSYLVHATILSLSQCILAGSRCICPPYDFTRNAIFSIFISLLPHFHLMCIYYLNGDLLWDHEPIVHHLRALSRICKINTVLLSCCPAWLCSNAYVVA